MEKVFNAYGASRTASEFAKEHSSNPKFHEIAKNENVLGMRFYIQSWGFNRITRAFAKEVIKAA